MTITTSLNFAGQTEAALDFYRDAVGCETHYLMRFRECPDKSFITPGSQDLVFHATFEIDGTELTASDVGHDAMEGPDFAGFALMLRPESVEMDNEIFGKLSNGGKVVVPFAPSGFTGWYGVATDRFGLTWKINVPND